MIITIDGGAASGKSSISSHLSKMIKYTVVHSGQLYRAVCKHVLSKGISVKDIPTIIKCAQSLQLTEKDLVMFVHDYPDESELHNEQIEAIIPDVASLPGVRTAINTLIRQNCSNGNYIVEGRDSGTNIFPDAEIKFFLEASLEVRAQRRLKQGYTSISLIDEMKQRIQERDRQDVKNTVGSLTIKKDMYRLDTGCLTVSDTCEKIKRILNSRGIYSNG